MFHYALCHGQVPLLFLSFLDSTSYHTSGGQSSCPASHASLSCAHRKVTSSKKPKGQYYCILASLHLSLLCHSKHLSLFWLACLILYHHLQCCTFRSRRRNTMLSTIQYFPKQLFRYHNISFLKCMKLSRIITSMTLF